MPNQEKAKYFAALLVVTGAFAWFGSSLARPAPKITFENLGAVKNSEGIKRKAADTSAFLVVEVAGAVRRPGVYRLKHDARIHDAIREAGGAKPNANLTEWNLAAKLKDGVQIYISSKGANKSSTSQIASARTKPKPLPGIPPLRVGVPDEFLGGSTATAPYGKLNVEPEGTAKSSSKGKKEPPAEGSIFLNSASADQLQQIPGIGPSTALKIVEYRQDQGQFQSIDELLAVKGIGPKKLDSIRKYLRL